MLQCGYHPASRASRGFLCEEEKSLSGRRSPNFWTSQSCFLSSNWFFFFSSASIRLLINWWSQLADVPSARLLGMGFELYSRNMPRMLNKDRTRIMQSLSRVQQNQASERRALLAGCMSICSYPQSVLTLFLYFFAPRQVKTLQKRTKKSQMTLKHYFMKCAVWYQVSKPMFLCKPWPR